MADSILETAQLIINQISGDLGENALQKILAERAHVGSLAALFLIGDLFFLGFSWYVSDSSPDAKWVLPEQVLIGEGDGGFR